MKNIFRISIVTLVLLCSVSSYGVHDGLTLPFNEEVRWALKALPPNVDNLDWRSLDRWFLITHLFDTLIDYDANQNLVSAIAKRWTVSPDRKTITFYLDPQRRFSNGRLITANDVVYSIKRYILLQNQNALVRKIIRGADRIRKIPDRIEGVQSLDVSTVQLKLTFATDVVWFLLAQPYFGIVAQESVNPTSLKMLSSIASSGPYKIAYSNPNYYRLEANPYFNDGQIYSPKTIGLYRYKNFEEAESWFLQGKTNFFSVLDPFETTILTKLNPDNVQIIAHPYHRLGLLYLNGNNHLFQNSERRQLFAKALSPSITKTLKNQYLSWEYSFFSPGTVGYIPFDPSSVVQQQIPKIKSGKPINILVEAEVPQIELEELIKNRFGMLGFSVQFERLPKREIVNRMEKGDFDICMMSVGFPMFGPELALYYYFVEDPSYFKDPTGKIRDGFFQWVKTNDQLQRQKILKKINQQILSDGLLIPIYHTGVQYILSKELSYDAADVSRVDIKMHRLRVKK